MKVKKHVVWLLLVAMITNHTMLVFGDVSDIDPNKTVISEEIVTEDEAETKAEEESSEEVTEEGGESAEDNMTEKIEVPEDNTEKETKSSEEEIEIPEEETEISEEEIEISKEETESVENETEAETEILEEDTDKETGASEQEIEEKADVPEKVAEKETDSAENEKEDEAETSEKVNEVSEEETELETEAFEENNEQKSEIPELDIEYWVDTEDGRMFYQDGEPVIDEYIEYDGNTYYLDEFGYMYIGLLEVFDEDGNIIGWRYFGFDGIMQTSTQITIDDVEYEVNNEGMVLMPKYDMVTLSADTEADAGIPLTSEYFPDPNFRECLSELDCGYEVTVADENGDLVNIWVGEGDNVLSPPETNITILNVDGKGIHDLTGITLFANLEQLYCSNNNFDTLSVVNGLPNLKVLVCNSCNLSELELFQCTSLTDLECIDNHLTVLNVNNCRKLRRMYCYSNQLKELDVSDCIALERLECNSNQLNTLIFGNHPSLRRVECGSNNLNELNIENSIYLEDLICSSNNLSQLDVSDFPDLKSLDCSANNLTELDVSNNRLLDYLNCSNNKLEELDVSNHTQLIDLICYYNDSLHKLNASGCSSLIRLLSTGANLKEIDISGTQLGDMDLYSDLYVDARELLPVESGWQYDLTDLFGQEGVNQISFSDEEVYLETQGSFWDNGVVSFENGIVVFANKMQAVKFTYYGNEKVTLHVTLYFSGMGDLCLHNWGEGIVEDNGKSNGEVIITNTCQFCGEVKTESIIVKLRKAKETYDGEKKKIEVVVKDSDDNEINCITIRFENDETPLNAGTYPVYVRIEGDWNATVVREFKVEPQEISKIMSSIAGSTYIYDGKPKVPDIRLHGKDDHRILEEGTDYTVTYFPNNKDAGEVKVTATCINNYTGVKEGTIFIYPQSITSDWVFLSDNEFIFDGKTHLPKLTGIDKNGKIVSGKYCTVEYFGESKEVGIYSATVTFTGNYQGQVTKSYMIIPQGIEEDQVTLSDTEFVYDGREHLPTVEVKDKDENIVSEEYYTVSYSGTGIRKGIYSVTIEMKGGYEGTVTKYFTVRSSAASAGGSGGSGSSSGGSSGGGSSIIPGPSGSSSGNTNYYVGTLEGHENEKWVQTDEGNWNFYDANGEKITRSWASVYNPYADTNLGQPNYDWFFFDENGNLVTGWYQDDEGDLYYLNPLSDNTKGRMLTGWQLIDGNYYYFNEQSDGKRGRMLRNAMTPDGFWVDDKGVRK